MAACLVCGRRVAFLRKRAATYSHDIYVAIDALRTAELAIGDVLDGEPVRRLVTDGQAMLETLHDWTHAFRGAAPIDGRALLARLDLWRRNVNTFVKAWACYDRPSYEEHCHSLPQHEARFVRSMVSGSVA